MRDANYIRTLIEQLNDASEAYYSGKPYMSDLEFDHLYDELVRLESETGIIYSNSPTQNVGSKILSDIPKVNIKPIPMLSLKKIHTQNEVNNFINNKKVVYSVKCDGLSMRLIYRNGQLFSANTRGNGVEGGLITEHAKCFLNIPTTIPYKEEYIIDGEAIIKYNDFNDIAKAENLQNPRNGAAGSLNTLDLNIVKRRKLSFIAWDVIQGGESNSYLENLKQAESYGFEIVYSSLNTTTEEILDIAKMMRIPCDGVVLRYDDIVYGQTLGRTEKAFNHAVAWKPNDEAYETTLLNIEWQLGRTGRVTPIAVFEPVEIDGSTVEKASLHNISIMRELSNGHECIGDVLHIIKSNMIIPQVTEWIHTNAEAFNDYLEIPDRCPVCGGPVIVRKDNESEVLFCDNPNCSGKFITSLKHFVSKQGLDVKGLSEATLTKLVDWGWIERYSDIFTLSQHRDEWVKKPGFGVASVDKVLAAIEKASHCDLPHYISSLGIPLVGLNTAKELCKYFPTWNSFIKAIEENYPFYQLSGFGREISNSLKGFDYSEGRYIAHNFLTFAEPEEKETAAGGALEGKTFVITGSLTHFAKRDDLKKVIEEAGGKVAGSVSGKTSYLINNDAASSSSKNVKAKNLGIPIITEEDFLKKFGF